MVHLLFSWLFAAIGFLVAARALQPGFQVRDGFAGALVAAGLFGVLNALVGWFVFFALGIATLGVGFLLAFVTRIVANAIVLKLTDALTQRLTIRGFGPAVLGALIISIVGVVGDVLVRR